MACAKWGSGVLSHRSSLRTFVTGGLNNYSMQVWCYKLGNYNQARLITVHDFRCLRNSGLRLRKMLQEHARKQSEQMAVEGRVVWLSGLLMFTLVRLLS